VSDEDRFNSISSEIVRLRYTIICLAIVVVFTTITTVLLLVAITGIGPPVVQALSDVFYILLFLGIVGAIVGAVFAVAKNPIESGHSS
jgi:hypothetical protein